MVCSLAKKISCRPWNVTKSLNFCVGEFANFYAKNNLGPLEQPLVREGQLRTLAKAREDHVSDATSHQIENHVTNVNGTTDKQKPIAEANIKPKSYAKKQTCNAIVKDHAKGAATVFQPPTQLL